MLDKLIIKIDGDATDFASKVGAVEKGFNNFSNGVSSGVKKIAGVTAATIGTLGAIGLKYNADMEMYTSNFKVMLGSQEDALKKVEELKEFAAKTPFAMADLAQGTKTLLAFGIESDESTKILGQLGDVALGDADKFNSLATVFGQVSSAGKLQGGDLLQLINAGFNPLQVISEQTGQSMSELKDQMSAGAISAEMMADAFEVATSEGGQFYNGMAEASQTTDGLISTLKDNATALVGEVFQPISDGILQELLPAALGYVDQLSKAFKTGGVDGLVKAAGDILGDVINEFTAKLPEFLKLGTSLITSILQGLADNSAEISRTISVLIMGMKSAFEQSIPLLKEIAKNLISNLALGFLQYKALIYETAIELIVSMVEGIADNATILTDEIFDMIEKLLSVIIESIPKLLDAAVEIMEGLAESIKGNLPLLVEQAINGILLIASSIIEHLQPILEAGLEILIALGKGIIDALPLIIVQLPIIISALIDFFIGAIPQIIQAGIDLFLALIEALPEIIIAIVEALPQIIVSIVAALIEAIPLLIKAGFDLFIGIIKAMPEIIVAIVKAIPALVMAIVKSLNTLHSKVQEVGKKAIQGLWKGITGAFSWLKNKIGGFIVGIVEKFMTIQKKVQDVGKNIAMGIWDGISNSFTWIKNKIKGWVGNIVSFIKKLFKIHSPSKLMADDVGFQIGAGTGVGIEDSTPLVLKSAKKQMNALKSAYSTAQSMFSFGGNYGAGNYAQTNNTTTKSTMVAPVMNFYEPIESPDTVAREVDKVFTYGLAGAY